LYAAAGVEHKTRCHSMLRDRGGGEEVYVAWGVHAIERINAPAVSGVFE
jgi:hypothetical protein